VDTLDTVALFVWSHWCTIFCQSFAAENILKYSVKMAARGDLIAQFIEITGTDENVARFYLSSCDWDIEVSFRRAGDNNDAANAASTNAPKKNAKFAFSARSGQLLEHSGGFAGSGAIGGPRGQPETKADFE